MLKKEVVKTQNKEYDKAGEYRQMLVQAIHRCVGRGDGGCIYQPKLNQTKGGTAGPVSGGAHRPLRAAPYRVGAIGS